MLLQLRDDPLLDVAGNLGLRLVIDAGDLLIALGDDPDFRGRAARRVADQRRCDPHVATLAGQRGRRLVHPGDGHERCPCAKRHDIVRDVGGAADPLHLVLEGDDRYRGFG